MRVSNKVSLISITLWKTFLKTNPNILTCVFTGPLGFTDLVSVQIDDHHQFTIVLLQGVIDDQSNIGIRTKPSTAVFTTVMETASQINCNTFFSSHFTGQLCTAHLKPKRPKRKNIARPFKFKLRFTSAALSTAFEPNNSGAMRRQEFPIYVRRRNSTIR